MLCLITAGLGLLFSGATAGAQSSTSLAIVPENGDLLPGQEITVALEVTGGVDVNAFDVTITYNPAVLELRSWSPGDYLSNLSQVYQKVEAGSFQVVYTQLARPPKSGDGTLLNLVFRAVRKGISPVSIAAAEFAGGSAGEVFPERSGGFVLVHEDPDGIASYPLSGSIGLQGRGDRGGITLDLGYGLQHWLGPYQATSSDLPGENLSFGAVYEDQYRLSVNVPGYLSLDPGLEKIKTVDSTHTTITPLILRGGNAVWQETVDGVTAPNQVIDEADLSLVTGQYREEGPGLTGDVNFDGRIDILDLALVAGNYELTAGAAYHDWLP